MKKIKNHLWRGFLFIGLLFLTTNCSNDNENVLAQKSKPKIIVKQLNYQDVLSDNVVIQKIKEIKQKKESILSNKSTDNKYIAKYDFTIDLETAKMVETDNYKTYNFLIYRESPEDDRVENLFLTLNKEGKYDAFILKYGFSSEELVELDQETLNNRQTEYKPIDIDFTPKDSTSSKYICTEVWEYIIFISPRDFGGDADIGMWVLVSSECAFYYEGAGISVGSSGNNDTTGSGGGGSGTSTTSTSSYIYSAPVVLSAEEIAIKTFFKNLTPEQEDCLNSNFELHKEIEVFLSNNYNPNTEISQKNSVSSKLPTSTNTFADAQNFAKLVLDNCGSNVDWANRIINKLTNPCASNIFTELQNEMLKKDLINKVEATPDGSPLTFVESILKLFNDSDGTNLLIRNSNNIGNSNAHTIGTTITLKTSYLKTATQLSIARTMIHEILHTYLNGIYLDLPDFENKTLLEKMEKFATDNGYDPINDPNRFQHEFMGQFVDAMAYSLYDWDKNYGTGGNLGWNYYKSMAFAGFIYAKKDSNGNYILDNNGNKIYDDTDSFKELVPNQTDRDNIKKIISDETEGNSNSRGSKCE